MVRGAINIKLTIEEKVPAQKKIKVPAQKKIINVSIPNQKSSSSTYKHSGGSSSRVTETYKAGFVEESSGRAGYKRNATYKSIHKVNDKVHPIRKNSSSTYKNSGGSSRRVTEKTEKTGVFVDGRSGRQVYRKEANYKSSYKVNGKGHGVTTEFETSVKCKCKCKKTTTYDNSNKYKRVTNY